MQDELDKENPIVTSHWEANYNCSGIEKEETIYSGYHRNDQWKINLQMFGEAEMIKLRD